MNPETIESNRQPHRRLLGVGLAMLTAAGLAELSVLPTEASASNNPQATATAEGLPNQLPLGELATGLTASKAVDSNPSTDLVHLWHANCSGMIIKDEIKGQDVPVGVVFTSSQCIEPATEKSKYLFLGGEEASYGIGKPLTAGTGASLSALKPLGDLTQLVILSTGHNSDLAMGVFDGYTTSEVYQGYAAEHLSNTAVNTFKPGKTTIDVYEPSDNKKDPKFEPIAATFIGSLEEFSNIGSWGPEPDRREAFIAIPKSESKKVTDIGANSQEAIGLPGFIEEGGQKKILGIVTANYSLKIPNYLDFVKGTFRNTKWDKYMDVLGISYILPKNSYGHDGAINNIAPQEDDIFLGEGKVSTDQLEYEAILAFNNPNITRTKVNGYAVVTQTNPNSGEKTTYVMNNPLITSINGSTILGYYDYPGALDAVDISAPHVTASFYQENANTPLVTKTSTGEMIFPTANANQKTGLEGIKPGSFVSDQHGEKFGALLTSANGINETEPNTAVFQNGQWVFSPSSS